MNHLLPRRNWTVHLIHHTHTDVGFTDSQQKITRCHADYLDQAIALAHRATAPDGNPDADPALRGFIWTNECHWSIEQWLTRTPPHRHRELIDAIRTGAIALSGTYLHFTELPDAPLHHAALARARAFAQKHTLPLDTALSADVNGFGWHYAAALLDAGIQNLVTCVHAHHGLAPIGRRQLPFYWQTHDNRELLVWNGEHYNLGNALGLAPGAVLTYDFTDELRPATRTDDTLPIALTRLPRYLRQLEDDNYPYDFVPLHLSGAMTDNSPPTEAIIRFVHRWNIATTPADSRAPRIILRMSSPAELCHQVRAAEKNIPIPRYRGDWPDWWSDGPASIPAEVRLHRAASRTRRWLANPPPPPPTRDDIAINTTTDQTSLEQHLLLFAEHTFNHSDSISAPWDINVKAIGGGKRALACAAWAAAIELRDAALAIHHGALPPLAPREAGPRFFYKALNPHTHSHTDTARLHLESKDFDLLPLNPQVIDTRTGQKLPCRVSPAPRGITCDVTLTLPPGDTARLELCTGTGALRSLARNVTERGLPDDIANGRTHAGSAPGHHRVETPHLCIEFSDTEGITTWHDKTTRTELLIPARPHAPFSPLYEVTPIAGSEGADMTWARSRLGRNRKGSGVRTTPGTLIGIEFPPATENWIPVTLRYSVEGCHWWRVTLDIWKNLPRVDATLRLHKTSVWEPENLHLALPFAIPGGQLWLDKPGAPIRPWHDQLPDTNTDWYSLQEGLASCHENTGLVIATPDAPLLHIGPLAHGPRRLMGNPALGNDRPLPYSWLMTNFWETNFDASLAGFHEYRYRVESGPHLATPVAAMAHLHALALDGFPTFRVSE